MSNVKVKDWESIYKAILEDIVDVIENRTVIDEERVERITEILVGNDFMEKPLRWG